MKNLYLIAILVIMSALYTQAQSACGEGNPINSNEWLQNQQTSIINSASLGMECTGGYIQEYVYNGEPAIYVYQECMNAVGILYNCDGQFLCLNGFDVPIEEQCQNFNQAEFVTQWWSYSCLCTGEYEPVCVDGNLLFDNACLAECAGYSPSNWVEGECVSTPTTCEFEDALTDLEWLANLTANSNCCFENEISEMTTSDGSTYFYVVPSAGGATCPTDIPAVLYDCEGEAICYYGFGGVTQECLDLLNSGELALIWDCTSGPIGGNDCEVENPLEELEWLAQQQESLISIVDGSPILCTGAIISEFVYNEETVFWVEAFCLDSGASIYDCEGNFICYVGGLLPPEEQCLDFFENAGDGTELWSYEGCNCELIFEPVCADGITFDNACLAECEGFLDWIPGECNEACQDLTISAFQGCGGDCGCDNLLELSANGGDGNYTFTLPDGQVVTDGFDAENINNWQDILEVTVTDGQGCIISTFMELPLLCCDAPPCAEVYEITTECSEENANCILVVNLSDNNACEVEILDQDGNTYTEGQELADGDYTFTAYSEGSAGDDCSVLGSYNVTVENPFVDALDQLSKINANIYPNPTDGLFNLEIEGQWNVQIYSITGELILEQNNDYQFDLSNANNGLYFVKVTNNQGSFISRLIIQ